MGEQTHRERVLLALNHEDPDRVPIDFGAMRSTGIHIFAYMALKRYLGIEPGRPKVYDLMQMLAEPEPEVSEQFGADVVQLHLLRPAFGIPIDSWKEGFLPNGKKCLYPAEFEPVMNEKGEKEIVADGRVLARMARDGFWFDFADFPLRKASSKKDIDAYPFYEIDEEEVVFLKEQVNKLKKDYPDYAVLGAFMGSVFEQGMYAFGFEQYLILLIENPSLINHFSERAAEAHIQSLRRYFEVVGEAIDVIHMGDDLGTQNGPYISPQLYRQMIKPYHKRIYDEIHRLNPKVKLFLHSCGSVYDLIPDFIEIGVDILNPVQTTAHRMDPQTLKREFGKDIVFWGGGVETQGVLLFGTPEQVRSQVRERLRVFAPGGGFVFNQIHNILPEIPPENVFAAYDEALRSGS
jgi:uroporphyrinogen decarboxylase